MNYYQHHIGDYRRDTAHLSLLEHGAYRQLLDMYYLSESPIPTETELVFRRLCAKTDEERAAVQTVLSEFFCLQTEPLGWSHRRCDSEICTYQSKAKVAQENGKLGGRPRRKEVSEKKTKPVIVGLSKKTDEKANQEPITINHKPITNNQAQGAQLPTPVSLSIAFCAKGIRTQSADPRLIALANQGVTVDLVNSACDAAKEAKPGEIIGIGYVLAILERWAESAKNLQAKGAQVPEKASPWWASDAGIAKKGAEMHLSARPGERLADFKSRIQAAIEDHANPPNKILGDTHDAKQYKKKSCKPAHIPALTDFLK